MKKPPLFRKVNTTARGVHDHFGGRYRDERNTKRARRSEHSQQPMHGQIRRGLDYTPLFRFLLARVGQPWGEVYSEALARLDRPEPIFWLVAQHEHEQQEYVRVGESSYYSGLFVDATGTLQRVNPALGPASLAPHCSCCTHTFNGIRFSQTYQEPSARTIDQAE